MVYTDMHLAVELVEAQAAAIVRDLHAIGADASAKTIVSGLTTTVSIVINGRDTVQVTIVLHGSGTNLSAVVMHGAEDIEEIGHFIIRLFGGPDEKVRRLMDRVRAAATDCAARTTPSTRTAQEHDA